MTAVVVTGASRGIGRATCLALADRRCRLILIGRPSPELDETVRAVTDRGGEAIALEADLTDAKATERTAQLTLDKTGPPDAVVNNAGTIERSAIVETAVDSWDRQLAVNLTAPFVLTRTLLPPMLARRSGRIVNVGSISSTLGTARAAAYCASKWGLVGLTKSLAEELRDTGLMTVTLLPGSVDTRMLEGSGFEPRITPEDVAKTLVYFALDAPVAHNGATVEMFGV